jgi:hypothetical protein
MTMTELHPARSVFSTEAVVPHTEAAADHRAEDLAAELLRCSELCRLAAEQLTPDTPTRSADTRSSPVRSADAIAAAGLAPSRGPRWSLQPARAGGRPAT